MGDDGPSSAWLADAIVAARRLAEAASREAMRGLPLDTGSAEFRRYLVNRLGCRREECVQVFYFNGEGIYIAEDLYTGGRRTECLIPLRRTVRRAFDLDARRIITRLEQPVPALTTSPPPPGSGKSSSHWRYGSTTIASLLAMRLPA
jgi:DNA repair protein RadC